MMILRVCIVASLYTSLLFGQSVTIRGKGGLRGAGQIRNGGTSGGTISNVSVLGVTATQATIKYDVSGGGACSVAVSEDPSYSPLVPDVDPALYTGANLDSRVGSVVNGVTRGFVAGKRAAEIDTNGDLIRYSRALQTATLHYYRITCGVNTATGTFTTTSIPFGMTYAEAEPIDPNNPGQYAWPWLSPSDRTQRITDPQTGLLMRRVSLPQDYSINMSLGVMNVGRAPAWTGLAHLLAQDNTPATISGSTSKLEISLPLGVYPTATGGNNNIGPLTLGYSNGARGAFGYYQLALVAGVNVGGVAPISPDDAKISACLTTDGVNCYPGTQTLDLALGQTLATVQTIGLAVDAVSLWQAHPGAHTPRWDEQAWRGTTVSCNNTTTVTRTGGDFFSPYLVAGSLVIIDGTQYSLSVTANTNQVILNSTCPSGTRAYTTPGLHALIWKKTASADTVSISYADVNAHVNYFSIPWPDPISLCSISTVVGPTSGLGYNCTLLGIFDYWIDKTIGQAYFHGQHINTNLSSAGSASQNWDGVNANVAYITRTGSLLAMTYWGNLQTPTTVTKDYSVPICTGSPPYTAAQPCWTETNVTPSTSLPTLAVNFTSNGAFAPQFDPSIFSTIFMSDIDDTGNIIFAIPRGGQLETISWILVFDPNAHFNVEGGDWMGMVGNHGCVGGGNPGCMVAAMPAWARHGCRWCVMKGVSSSQPGWTVSPSQVWEHVNAAGAGAYIVQVGSGVADGVPNFLDGSTTLIPCPTNTFGAPTGGTPGTLTSHCSKLVVTSEPFTQIVHSGETGAPGEAGDMVPGDRLATSIYGENTAYAHETMMLIAKTASVTSGQWVYTIWRGINQGTTIYPYAPFTTGTNPVLYTMCEANGNPQNLSAAEIWNWNFIHDPHGMNADNLGIPPSNAQTEGHGLTKNGTIAWVGLASFETTCSHGSACYQSTLTKPPATFADALAQIVADATIITDIGFAGAPYDAGNTQSHPSPQGANAPSPQIPYMFDNRPYAGGFGSGCPTDPGAGNPCTNPATNIAGQLWRFRAADVPLIQFPWRKNQPTSAFTGDRPLVDVSGPGSVIGSTSADSYKYCVSSIANECVTGSLVGDVYANAPIVDYPYCYQGAQNGNIANQFDLCISASPVARDAFTQIYLPNVDNTGASQRVLAKPGAARDQSIFDAPVILNNGLWAIIDIQFPGDGSTNKTQMAMKIPPILSDATNRTTWIPRDISIPNTAGSDGAYIRFGYAEFGTPTQFYCTSRKELCIAAAGQTGTDPYWFNSQTWSPVACTGGCTVRVNSISQRNVYYQIVHTASGSFFSADPMDIFVTP